MVVKGIAGVPNVPDSATVKTITAILEAGPDGTVHLPVPEALRHSKLSVTAIFHVLPDPEERPTQGEAMAALRKLREMGAFKAISDPVAWQREIRTDRSLPGRD